MTGVTPHRDGSERTASTDSEGYTFPDPIVVLQQEINVLRSENARLRTAVTQHEGLAVSAQARCDAAQDRLSAALAVGESMKAQRDRYARLEESERARAAGLADRVARQRQTIHELTVEAPAHRETIREAKGPEHTITEADVDDIAQAVVGRLIERVGSSGLRAAAHAMTGGLQGAATILQAAASREPEVCPHEVAVTEDGGMTRTCVRCGAVSKDEGPFR